MVLSSPEDRAKAYSSLKYALSLLDIFWSLALLFIFAASGASGWLAAGIAKAASCRILAVALYVAAASIGYYLLSFPVNFYRSYTLEHKFNLSTQNIRDWALDQAKSGMISYIIALILLAAFYFILENIPQYWWLVISLFWIFFSLILAKLLPVVIIPLFFKYKALTDTALRERIMRLAGKMKVKILDCFEIDFSKKTLKANAAFVGWGSTRRVILADTLKDKYSPDEIEVILAHEFAHCRLKHLLKLILANSCVTIFIFYLIFKTSSFTLRLFGFFSLSEVAALPVVLIYFVLCGLLTQPLENYLSRIFEKNADRLALETTGAKEAFISMMEKLGAQNLADKNPHPLIKFFFFDHPPISERIDMAKNFK